MAEDSIGSETARTARPPHAIAVIVAVLLAVPAAYILSQGDQGGPAIVALVRATVPEITDATSGVEVVEPYDAFVLIRAPADRLRQLTGRGIVVEPQDSAYWITLKSIQFDVRQGEPALPEEFRSDAGDHYLVHFIGPIKANWITELQTLGVSVLHSVPTHAFLVAMDERTRETVRGLRFVDWVGPYHPGYKLHPELEVGNVLQTVQIITFSADDVTPVLTWLADHGIVNVPRTSTGVGILTVFTAGELGVVRVHIESHLLAAIARLNGVMSVEPWRPPQIENSNAQGFLQTGLPASDPNARRLWDQGLRGQDQIVAVADTGIDFDSNFFRESTSVIQKGASGDTTGTLGPLSIYNITDLSRRKIVRYFPMSVFLGIDPWSGGDPEAIKDSVNAGGCPSGHGTSVAGNVAGWDEGIGTDGDDGMAPDAKIFLQDIGSVGPSMDCPFGGDTLSYIPDDYDDLFGIAYGGGARVHSNSWGSDTTDYDLQAMMVDRFIWNHPDMAIFFAAGNSGPGASSVQSPSTAKSVITIAGANPSPNQESLASQSSRGPTADRRSKPDVTTFFTGMTASSSGNPLDGSNAGATRLFGGTSHATPLAAGMGALVRQYFAKGWYPTGAPVGANGFEPTAALVKAILLTATRRMTDSTANQGNTYPNNAQGWGRIALDDSLYLNPGTPDLRKLWVVDERQGLGTGEAADYRILVATGSTPLRIALAWSDYPGLPNSNPASVNNLNLLVTGPDGDTYKGNVFGTFTTAESTPNAGGFDPRNTTEGVIVNAPAPGAWRVRIEGGNVPAGPQPFAIVAVADLDLGYGDVLLNQRVYGTGDTIQIEVRDANAASASVNIRSSTEAAGETAALTATAPGSGVWRGTIPLASGAPVPGDGMLQVSEADTILARYSDAVPSHIAVARATIDASPPSIANVHAEGLGQTSVTITWTTDEPSDSTVYFGTSPSGLTSLTTVAERTTAHSVRLVSLLADTVYYYDVESKDPRGLLTRDRNGGSHYTFRTTTQKEILLVIGENSFPATRVAMYRDALAASGWSFDEWDARSEGDPPIGTLRLYKAVLWQPGLEQYPPVSDSQRALLKTYLDGGGRVFLSSHDVAWASCSQLNNPYYLPARCTWFQSVLKADWQQDPSRWSSNSGISGDPISGPYGTGVAYSGHREGGYGDEVDNLCGTTTDGAACVRAGATTRYVWLDNDVNAVDHISVRWNATATNGTLGTGVWGGTPSRVASFFFEWSGLAVSAGSPSSPIRTDVLNRTVIWLLDGREAPAVRLRSPNGGETLATNSFTIEWTRTAAAGVASQVLYYSDNSGERWNFLDNVLPGVTSYVWDLSSLPNGGRYRIRVAVADGGTPSITGEDASDRDFSIQRAGGDLQGPLIRPGSVLIDPNPIVAGQTVVVRAVAEEGNRGNSTVAGAEIFRGAAPGANGTGTAMTAVDGTFDGATETVRWSVTATWPPGGDCLWVHGRDAQGNWGPFESRCTETIPSTGLDGLAPVAPVLALVDLPGGFNDVAITWQRASDGGDVGGTYLYHLFRATALGGLYARVGGDVLEDGAVSYRFLDGGAGDAAPSMEYFYFVQSVDLAGNVANGTSRAAKMSIDLPSGPSFLSVPIVLTDTSPAGAFRTAPPRAAWAYNSCTDTWSSYSPNRAPGDNSLRAVTPAMGLFIDLLSPDRLTFVGVVPETTDISLCAGWNFIGFPRFTTMTVAEALAASGADTILGFDAAAPPGRTKAMAPTDVLERGRAYWIHTATPATWTVPSG
ncbi:MAG TPA: S8 family serine peptidase [Thermoplasmata archaeon]|nr:S8 family serine peptidase [Thermoplasmata archaeon]